MTKIQFEQLKFSIPQTGIHMLRNTKPTTALEQQLQSIYITDYPTSNKLTSKRGRIITRNTASDGQVHFFESVACNDVQLHH